MLTAPDASARPLPPAPSRVAAAFGGTGLALGLGFAVAALPLEQAALLVGVCLVVGLALVDPTTALAGLLLSVPFSTVSTVEGDDFAVSAIEPLLALLLAAWFAWALAARRIPLHGARLLAPLGLVLLFVLLSVLSAQQLGLWFKETAKWLELIAVYAFTVAHLAERRRQYVALAALLLAAGVEGLFGAFQYLTGSGPATFAVGEALRAYGHFEQPNPFAGYLATVLPLALVLALRRGSRPLTGLALFALGGTMLGILLSQSRGAWLGTAMGVAVMLLAWSPKSRAILGLGLLSLPAAIVLAANRLVPPSWTERLTSVVENFGLFDVRTVQLTSENFALVERMAHWQAGWYMFLDHPLLGVGAGNYPAAYDEYALPGWREALGHAHNYYLNMAAETGLLGLVALVLLFAAVYGLLLGGLRRTGLDSDRRALLAGLLGSFVVLTVHNFFDNLLVHGVQVQIGFFMGLATLLAAEMEATSQSVPGPVRAATAAGRLV